MNRRGFLAMLGLGAAAAPAVPRRVYSFLWGAPGEPIVDAPFFGIDRANPPLWSQDTMSALMKRLYSVDAIEKALWDPPRQQRVVLVHPEQYRGIKAWCAENPL